MINFCSKCRRPLKEEDKIKFTGFGVYHALPSQKAWAISKEAFSADVRSIQHVQCDLEEQEGD